MKSLKFTLFVMVAAGALGLTTQAFADDHAKAAKQYKQCAAVRMKEINLDHLSKDPDKYTTKIPEGWTVVGSAGGEGHPKLLICR